MDFVGEESLNERQKAILKIATEISTKCAKKSYDLIHARLNRLKPICELDEGVDCILNSIAILTFEAIINLKNNLSTSSKKDTSIFELLTVVNSMVTDRLRFHQEKKIIIKNPKITKEVMEMLFTLPEDKLAIDPISEDFLRIKALHATGVKIVLHDGTII